MVGAVLLAVAWLLAASAAWRGGVRALTPVATAVAAGSLAGALWSPLVPVVVAAWAGCALALPAGVLRTAPRRVTAGAMLLPAAAWTAWLAASGRGPGAGAMVGWAVAASAVAGVGLALHCRRVDAARRRVVQWVVAGVVVAVAAEAVLVVVHWLLGLPPDVLPWTLGVAALAPLGLALGLVPSTARHAERALAEAIVVGGLTLLVVAVYLVVVVGLGRMPQGGEREILLASVIAALTAVVLALPVRARLLAFGRAVLRREGTTPEEALTSFGARMSRAVPFDELLLQLAESLHATLGTAGAEVWVGTEGVLDRAVSVPHLPPRRLSLSDKERVVAGRTRVAGPAWLAVWLPELLAGAEDGAPVRVAPTTHLGELHGLLVVRRDAGASDFTEENEQVLVELARQVGLALHNMRLDTALQASLSELELRNAELQASRLRIVTAADSSRRAIERDLHDGAQQHLVALSVKLGLARELVQQDAATASELLDQLRADVQETIQVLRELAHGIYPPLLRDHGLEQALASVARRAALPCEVCVDLPGRYPEEIEAAAYFCCLEAIQNAGKHAGQGAEIAVRVWSEDGALRFEVADDGAGFAPDAASGHGFVNMTDRLGAIGGTLSVESHPGKGTRVTGRVPARPVRTAATEPV
ncbi:MAG TPA: histidine kinase [Streptosporangiales bacterium]